MKNAVSLRGALAVPFEPNLNEHDVNDICTNRGSHNELFHAASVRAYGEYIPLQRISPKDFRHQGPIVKQRVEK